MSTLETTIVLLTSSVAVGSLVASLLLSADWVGRVTGEMADAAAKEAGRWRTALAGWWSGPAHAKPPDLVFHLDRLAGRSRSVAVASLLFLTALSAGIAMGSFGVREDVASLKERADAVQMEATTIRQEILELQVKADSMAAMMYMLNQSETP